MSNRGWDYWLDEHPKTYYDYVNQAYFNEIGVYATCGHPESVDCCQCPDRVHKGQRMPLDVLENPDYRDYDRGKAIREARAEAAKAAEVKRLN